MPGGDLADYIKEHPSADRLGLASTPAVVFDHTLALTTNYLISLKGSTFSTPIT